MRSIWAALGVAVLGLAAAPAAAQDWSLSSADGATIARISGARDYGLGEFTVSCTRGTLGLAYVMRDDALPPRTDIDTSRLLMTVSAEGLQRHELSSQPRTRAAGKYTYPVDPARAAELAALLLKSDYVIAGIVPKAVAADKLPDASPDYSFRFIVSRAAVEAVVAACPAKAPEPSPPPAPPAPPAPSVDEGVWRVEARKRDTSALVTADGITFGFVCADGAIAPRLDLPYARLPTLPAQRPPYLFLSEDPDQGGQYVPGMFRSENGLVSLRMDSLAPVSGLPTLNDLQRFKNRFAAGIATFNGDDRPERAFVAWFPMANALAATQAVKEACGLVASGEAQEGVWSVYRDEAGATVAAVARGEAVLEVTRYDCDLASLAYSFPAAKLHKDLVGRPEADLTFGRDGRASYSYRENLMLQVLDDRVHLGQMLSLDDGWLDDIARAGRSIDVGLARDGASGRFRNLTNFSARNSTAAIAELREGCR